MTTERSHRLKWKRFRLELGAAGFITIAMISTQWALDRLCIYGPYRVFRVGNWETHVERLPVGSWVHRHFHHVADVDVIRDYPSGEGVMVRPNVLDAARLFSMYLSDKAAGAPVGDEFGPLLRSR